MLFVYSLITTLIAAAPCAEIHKHLEWRELSHEQKTQYLQAVKCVRRLPTTIFKENVSNYYEQLAYIHYKQRINLQHTELFLPWHRGFIAIFDQTLRANCGYAGPMPYWDWSFDNAQPTKSQIWKAFGKEPTGCITMPIVGNLVSHFPDDHCVARDWLNGLQSSTYSEEEVRLILNTNDFRQFSFLLEMFPNYKVHQLVGGYVGDMGMLDWSVNDPLFFLHYRNIDRLWAKWQKENKQTFGDNDGPMSVLGVPSWIERLDYSETFPALPLVEVLNTTAGGFNNLMCYKYSNSITANPTPNLRPIAHSRPNSELRPRYFKRTTDNNLFKRIVKKENIAPNAPMLIFPKILNFTPKFLSNLNLTTNMTEQIILNEGILAEFNYYLNEKANIKPLVESDSDENSWNTVKNKRPKIISKLELDPDDEIFREKTDEEVLADEKYYDNLVQDFGQQLYFQL